MAYSNDPLGTPFRNPYKSNFNDLVIGIGNPNIVYQCLQQVKWWFGANQSRSNGRSPDHSWPFYYPGDARFWDGSGDPGVTYRTNYRKRYLANSCTWALGGASYTENSAINSVGVATTDGGMPTVISNGFPAVLTGSETRPFWPMINSATYRDVNVSDWDWTTGTFDWSDTGNTHHQNFSYGYSSEAVFSGYLSTAVSRLAARTFPSFGANPFSTGSKEYSEGWDEVGTGAGPTYAGTTLSLGNSDNVFMLPDWHAPNFSDRLVSFWGIATSEILAPSLFPFDNANENSRPIIATRTRFLVDKPARYWIGKARWINGQFGGGGAVSRGDVTDVTLVANGLALPGTPVEIPVHADSDFVVTGGNLSCGALCFACVGETPAAWSARTGITVH
jgi:hypothetical protein